MNVAVHPGIPTTYRGITFRSRLEATWACFFDLVNWSWEYEPIDLHGYIPDFVVQGAAPLLVEVKPAGNIALLSHFVEKIERSGWEHEALLVGTGPEDGSWRCRMCGVGDGNGHVGDAPDLIDREWAMSKDRVQWRHK